MPAVRGFAPWLAVALLVGACGGDDLVLPTDGAPAAIRVVDGDGQSGSVGALLGAPVVVEVTDGDGRPLEGATVKFTLTSGGDGAEISPSSAPTGADGRAEARVLLGDKVGLQTGEARLVGAPPRVSFSALAVGHDDPSPPPPSSPPPSPHPPAGNDAPKADFQLHCHDLGCTFTDQSEDADGTIVTRQWDFGDGSTSSERDPTHSYGTAGRFTVILSVTDNDGAGDTRSRSAETEAPPSPKPPPPEPPPASPPEPNKAPHADFHAQCTGTSCSFEDTSRDDDGTIVSWQWSFADGGSSNERNPVHAYSAEGQYEVMLTATDDDGAAATRSHKVHVKKH